VGLIDEKPRAKNLVTHMFVASFPIEANNYSKIVHLRCVYLPLLDKLIINFNSKFAIYKSIKVFI
jgi:hypothetical protein